nr:MAG TPA: hypothetical protein [Caudoviricetes sp.]DAX91162.1 MAG TPA: hypothetical protein [Caudoviricetes sp.]
MPNKNLKLCWKDTNSKINVGIIQFSYTTHDWG